MQAAASTIIKNINYYKLLNPVQLTEHNNGKDRSTCIKINSIIIIIDIDNRRPIKISKIKCIILYMYIRVLKYIHCMCICIYNYIMLGLCV